MYKYKIDINKKVFINFLIPYIIISILPLLGLAFLYSGVQTSLEKNILSNVQALLEKTKAVMDIRLTEIDSLVKQAHLEINMLNIDAQDDSNEDQWSYNMLRLNKRMQAIVGANIFIEDYYIYFNKNGSGNMFSNYLQDGEKQNGEWLDKVVKEYNYRKIITVKNASSGRKLIFYIQSFPFGDKDFIKGQIIFLLNEKEISKLFGQFNLFGDGYAYISNSRNDIVAITLNSEVNEIKPITLDKDSKMGVANSWVDGRYMTVVYSKSTYNDWRYVLVMPFDKITKELQTLNGIVYSGIFLILVIGIIFAFILAKNKASSVKDIIKKIPVKPHESNESPYTYLQKTLNEMINKTKNIDKEIKEQKPQVQMAIFDRLLYGRYRNESDIVNQLSNADLNISAEKYVFFLCEISQQADSVRGDFLEELQAQRIILKRILEDNTEGYGYLHETIDRKFAVLLRYNNEEENQVLEKTQILIENIYNQLLNEFRIETIFGVANVFCQITGLTGALVQATYSLEYNQLRDTHSTIWFSKIPKKYNWYYYPSMLEMQIINLVIIHNKKSVKQSISNLYRENILERELSLEITTHFAFALKGTIYRIIQRIGSNSMIRELLGQLEKSKKIEEKFRLINKLFEELCDLTAEEGNKTVHQTITQVIDYIDINFTNKDLTVKYIAEYFQISEKYFSHKFKDSLGESASTYIERKRIEYACQLLSNSDEQKIADISSMVGYTNDLSFRRAFKKVTGINPKDFRKKPE